jgi:hypothetical protein
MAEPMMPRRTSAAPSGALQLLEDAVRLLRDAPFSTLAWHYAGSLPMAAGGAFFWNEITHPSTEGPRLVVDALLLAVLLGWLNICRAVYASRLRDQLAGFPPQSAGVCAIWRMAPVQVLLGATKLAVLPLAILSTILLAPAVAFYRNAAALSAREADTGQLIAKARRFARYRGSQSWKALGLLACLYPLILANVVMTLAILPQFTRMLTGYESVFSRLGPNLLEDPLFWTLAFALTWLIFDPFVGAVYCLRCFQAEAAGTGEDVKAVIRSLQRGVAVAALLVLSCAIPLHAQTAPAPDLQRAVQDAARSPEYDWRIAPKLNEKQQPSWFVAATDRIVDTTRAFLRSITDAIDRLLRWIFGQSEGPTSRSGAPPAGSLPAGLWILIVLILAAAGYAFVRRRYPPQRKVVPGNATTPVATQEDAEDMDPLRFPEQAWIDLAERALAEQNWRLAMRAFYLASLGWLGRREFLQIHSGKTNREYELELRRRTRTVPQARDLFAGNVAAFERAWYGMHEIGGEDVERFRTHMREMQQYLETAS